MFLLLLSLSNYGIFCYMYGILKGLRLYLCFDEEVLYIKGGNFIYITPFVLQMVYC